MQRTWRLSLDESGCGAIVRADAALPGAAVTVNAATSRSVPADYPTWPVSLRFFHLARM